MISLCRGLILHHSDIVSQIVVAVTVPLDFLVQLRGCLILYVVNYVRPCYLEGFFNLPGQYFYRRCLRLLLHVTRMCRMSRILHDVSLWWIGASHGCPRFWTLVQLRKFSPLLVAALSFRSYPFLDSFLKQQSCLLDFLEYTWVYYGGGLWKPLMIII